MCQCDDFCECSGGVGCIETVDVFFILTKCAHVFCHKFSLIAPGFNFRASV